MQGCRGIVVQGFWIVGSRAYKVYGVLSSVLLKGVKGLGPEGSLNPIIKM